ncbi:hypothetical protein QYM36_017119 [Artemia franciscana]|uniref:Uncharacterized protein n=1 Tax=Artemia franciscana TaxID=6661 RepID=A0AA88H9N8_ARTSF|nr:hypothetical protein QYM36_017119 [Artemia franciscana]
MPPKGPHQSPKQGINKCTTCDKNLDSILRAVKELNNDAVKEAFAELQEQPTTNIDNHFGNIESQLTTLEQCPLFDKDVVQNLVESENQTLKSDFQMQFETKVKLMIATEEETSMDQIYKVQMHSHYDMFKKCRNGLRNLTWKIVENHKETIATDVKQNSKRFWCHVSPANASKNDIPDLMKEDDTKASWTKEKADLLNSSFGTNFSTQPMLTLYPL